MTGADTAPLSRVELASAATAVNAVGFSLSWSEDFFSRSKVAELLESEGPWGISSDAGQAHLAPMSEPGHRKLADLWFSTANLMPEATRSNHFFFYRAEVRLKDATRWPPRGMHPEDRSKSHQTEPANSCLYHDRSLHRDLAVLRITTLLSFYHALPPGPSVCD